MAIPGVTRRAHIWQPLLHAVLTKVWGWFLEIGPLLINTKEPSSVACGDLTLTSKNPSHGHFLQHKFSNLNLDWLAIRF